jgi:hypothetical protein
LLTAHPAEDVEAPTVGVQQVAAGVFHRGGGAATEDVVAELEARRRVRQDERRMGGIRGGRQQAVVLRMVFEAGDVAVEIRARAQAAERVGGKKESSARSTGVTPGADGLLKSSIYQRAARNASSPVEETSAGHSGKDIRKMKKIPYRARRKLGEELISEWKFESETRFAFPPLRHHRSRRIPYRSRSISHPAPAPVATRRVNRDSATRRARRWNVWSNVGVLCSHN